MCIRNNLRKYILSKYSFYPPLFLIVCSIQLSPYPDRAPKNIIKKRNYNRLIIIYCTRSICYAALVASLSSSLIFKFAKHGATNNCPDTTPLSVPTLTTTHNTTTQSDTIYQTLVRNLSTRSGNENILSREF